MGLFGIGDTAKLYSGLLGKKKSGGGPGAAPKAPQFQMKKTQDFIQNEAPVQIGGANGTSALDRRYASMRERVQGQANAAKQDANDQITRKFAAMGASGSGAEMKLLQESQDAAQRQTNDAMLGIDAQYQGELANRELAQADMDFKQRAFNFERGSKLHELDMAERQQQIDSVNTEFNKRMAEQMAKPPQQGFLSRFIGDIL